MTSPPQPRKLEGLVGSKALRSGLRLGRALILLGCGLGCITFGLWAVYPPAALVVLGAALLALGLGSET